MRVLVLGSGGREHALAWKIKQSPECEKVFLHPGNGGTRKLGLLPLELPSSDIASLEVAAKKERIDLVVIGPEALLAEGVSDRLREAGFLVFGPSQSGARLETSKVFSKEFMQRARVPTAPFLVAEDDRTLMTLASDRHSFPVVLKLDGLAAGKGVVVAMNRQDIVSFTDRIWKFREFGDGPHRVVIEEFLPGKEVSYIGLCDGTTFTPLSSCTDYKRLSDHHEGPNTGGMGVISPSPYFDTALEAKVSERIVAPVLAQMKKENLFYRGALYIGLMVSPEGDPNILEFNARMGDPETQALMIRLESDLLPYLVATAKGELGSMPAMKWSDSHSVYVVASAAGYPERPRSGDEISGWDAVSQAVLFFSGVKEENGSLLTAGGRVLGVGALGKTRQDARELAYRNMGRVLWPGMHFRTDIGG